jgi:hypothetical protein
VAGSVSPAAGAADADLVSARQSLDAGGTPQTFIVRTGQPATSLGVESYLLDQLPAGGYSLSVERRTIDAAGVETVVTGGSASATVVSGATAAANLTIP